MLKNFKKLLNLVIIENIFKYTTEKYKEHIKKLNKHAFGNKSDLIKAVVKSINLKFIFVLLIKALFYVSL